MIRWHCAAYLTFTDTLNLRELSADEFLALPDGVRLELTRISRAVIQQLENNDVSRYQKFNLLNFSTPQFMASMSLCSEDISLLFL